METKAVAVPDRTTERESLLAQASKLTVTDQASLTSAGDLLKGVVALRKKIEDDYAPAIEAAHQAHKAAIAGRNKHVTPLVEIEGLLRTKVGAFQQAERKRVEEEERQRRIAIEAEEKRVREAQAKAEEEARARQAEEAFEAACDGEPEVAARIMTEPIEVAPIAPVYIPPPAPVAKVAGLSSRETWNAEVVDLHALIQYAATCPKAIAESLLVPNLSTLNAMARNSKAALAVPGVVAKSSTSTTVR